MNKRDIVERAAREVGIATPEARAAVGAVFAASACRPTQRLRAQR